MNATIYECSFCDNKTTNTSDWGIDFENDYGDRYCGDCFSEYYGVCEVCDENCLKEEMVEATDEDNYEYSCCPDCEPSQQRRQTEKAEEEKLREKNNAGLMAMKANALTLAFFAENCPKMVPALLMAFDPTLTQKQRDRITRIRAERAENRLMGAEDNQ